MQWEQWRNNSDALVAGPIPAGEYTTLPVALQPSDVALQGSFTIYLGANRGRGQAYPNGAASNLVSYRWDDTGMVTGRCFRSKRLGVSCWTVGREVMLGGYTFSRWALDMQYVLLLGCVP